MEESWHTFVDEAANASRPRKRHCAVGVVLNELPGEAADQLAEALSRSDLTGASISAAMKRRGFDITGGTIQRHRRRVCSCE